MAFSFGFSGDDIDIDECEANNEVPNVSSLQEKDSPLPELVKSSKHDLNDWLSTLPSQISYNTLAIRGHEIARREIFDIRTQLMAEDSAGYDNEALIAGLEKGDIKPQFYEGGFKTWECALDLAGLVTGEEEHSGGQATHFIELGAGTAVPSLALFARLLSRTPGPEQRPTHFTLADYNASVLRLVTLPNLLLTWYNSRAQSDPDTTTERQPQQTQEELELDITPELIIDFKNDLTQREISISFISGAWSPEFVDLVFSATTPDSDERRHTLILASETIYSPSSLGAFSETLWGLLRRASRVSTAQTRALVAAKKVYFGVGGGVDEFLAVLADICPDGLDVHPKLDNQSEGVGRVVLEIGLAEDYGSSQNRE